MYLLVGTNVTHTCSVAVAGLYSEYATDHVNHAFDGRRYIYVFLYRLRIGPSLELGRFLFVKNEKRTYGHISCVWLLRWSQRLGWPKRRRVTKQTQKPITTYNAR